MICSKCRTAADVITELHSMDQEDVSGMYDYRARDFVNVARTLHSLCKDKCDCQHHIRREGENLVRTLKDY